MKKTISTFTRSKYPLFRKNLRRSGNLKTYLLGFLGFRWGPKISEHSSQSLDKTALPSWKISRRTLKMSRKNWRMLWLRLKICLLKMKNWGQLSRSHAKTLTVSNNQTTSDSVYTLQKRTRTWPNSSKNTCPNRPSKVMVRIWKSFSSSGTWLTDCNRRTKYLRSK